MSKTNNEAKNQHVPQSYICEIQVHGTDAYLWF